MLVHWPAMRMTLANNAPCQGMTTTQTVIWRRATSVAEYVTFLLYNKVINLHDGKQTNFNCDAFVRHLGVLSQYFDTDLRRTPSTWILLKFQLKQKQKHLNRLFIYQQLLDINSQLKQGLPKQDKKTRAVKSDFY